MATQNQGELGKIPPRECDEQRFIAFVNAARLDIVVPGTYLAIFFLTLVAFATHVVRAGAPLPASIIFYVVSFVGFGLFILPHRTRFVGLLRGDLSTAKMWAYGLAPLGILVPALGLAVFLSSITHESLIQLMPYEHYRPRGTIELFLAPFVEEVIFRVWLQTRLQQGFGKLGALFGGARVRPWFSAAGAVLCGILFMAGHDKGFSLWSINAFAAWVTWLRYRHRSLGATLIAHFAWDGTLAIFATLVLTHALK